MKRILLALGIVLLYSCSSKIKTTDVRLVGDEVFYEDKPYTGQVWTKDGESIVADVSDGRPVKFTLFHDNGKPAMVVIFSARDKEKKYYDINGYEMTKGDWIAKYPSVSMKRGLMDEEFRQEAPFMQSQ